MLIRTKVKFITIVLSFTMLFTIAVTYYLIQDEKSDAQIINVAGKQRMLTQKMIAELHRIGLSENEAREEFNEAKKQFHAGLVRLSTGDLSSVRGEEIGGALKEVEQSWHVFSEMTQAYAQTPSALLLQQIYMQGNTMLAQIERAVMLYEKHSRAKRDFINQVQLVLAFFSFFIILYMGSIALSIQAQLSRFSQHSTAISGRKDHSGGNELEEAYAHIKYFLDDVENAIDAAVEAVRQSEDTAIKIAKHDPAMQKHLDKNEDIVIEANEELHKTSRILKKLKSKLQDTAHSPF